MPLCANPDCKSSYLALQPSPSSQDPSRGERLYIDFRCFSPRPNPRIRQSKIAIIKLCDLAIQPSPGSQDPSRGLRLTCHRVSMVNYYPASFPPPKSPSSRTVPKLTFQAEILKVAKSLPCHVAQTQLSNQAISPFSRPRDPRTHLDDSASPS